MSQLAQSLSQSALVWFTVHNLKGYSLTLFRLISKEIKQKATLCSLLNALSAGRRCRLLLCIQLLYISGRMNKRKKE